MTDEDVYSAHTMVRRYGVPMAQHVAQQQADISGSAGFPQIESRWLRVKGEIARLGHGRLGGTA